MHEFIGKLQDIADVGRGGRGRAALTQMLVCGGHFAKLWGPGCFVADGGQDRRQWPGVRGNKTKRHRVLRVHSAELCMLKSVSEIWVCLR